LSVHLLQFRLWLGSLDFNHAFAEVVLALIRSALGIRL
jgi:hypothetical protein